jgi:hypothetical protein
MAHRAGTRGPQAPERPFGGIYNLLLRFVGTVILDKLVLHATTAAATTFAVMLCDPVLPDAARPIPAILAAVYDSLVFVGLAFRAAALDYNEWDKLRRRWKPSPRRAGPSIAASKQGISQENFPEAPINAPGSETPDG